MAKVLESAAPLCSADIKDYDIYESVINRALNERALPRLLFQWLFEYKDLLRLLLGKESDSDYLLSVRVLLSVIQHSNGFSGEVVERSLSESLQESAPLTSSRLKSMLCAPILMWNVEHELWITGVAQFFNGLSQLTSDAEVLKLAGEWVDAQNDMFRRLEIMCGKKMCGHLERPTNSLGCSSDSSYSPTGSLATGAYKAAVAAASSFQPSSSAYSETSFSPSGSMTRTNFATSGMSPMVAAHPSESPTSSLTRTGYVSAGAGMLSGFAVPATFSDSHYSPTCSLNKAGLSIMNPGYPVRESSSDLVPMKQRPVPASIMQLYYQYDALANKSALQGGLIYLVKNMRNTFIQEYNLRGSVMENESVALASLKPHRRQWLNSTFVLKELSKASDNDVKHPALAAELSTALAFHIKKQYVTFYLEGHKLGRRAYYLFEDAQRWAEAVAHMLSENPCTAPCELYPPQKVKSLVNEPSDDVTIDLEEALSFLPSDKRDFYRAYKMHVDASGITGRNAIIMDRFLGQMVLGFNNRNTPLEIPAQARGMGATKQQLLSKDFLANELFDALTKAALTIPNEAADAVEELSTAAAAHAIEQFKHILSLPKKVGRKRHFLFEDIKIWLRVTCSALQAMYESPTPTEEVDIDAPDKFQDAGSFFYSDDDHLSTRASNTREESMSSAYTLGKTSFYCLD
ncbi:MAG: hypothetical protein KVP17_004037 [Porospora cf. gigantea B]|uniref:uncharacterized protein n=1 Tax=Porospora cf. gigantea B TaxID=2853592 RepID=UPI003571C1FE|nr:MAG: hypothetical protein KVP17_004037 [Porospora cf. gigantea B]